MAQSPPDSGAVVVNEVMYAPTPSSNEFIELYNRSGRQVDLSRLEYADGNRDFDPVASTTVLLAPDEYVVLIRDSAAFEAAYPSVNDYRSVAGWQALNNGGDAVIVRHTTSGRVIDSIAFTPSWGGDEGRSLERIDPDGPSTSATNFGSATAEAKATPDGRNSIYNPDEDPPRPTFAEMTGETTAKVIFSEPVRAGTIVSSAFDLNSTRIESAALIRPSTARIALSSEPSGPTLRVRNVEDLVGNKLEAAHIPLGRQPKPGDLVINEIMFAPRTDEFDDRANQPEYVEVSNQSGRPLSLAPMTLTDRPDEEGTADTIRVGQKSTLRARNYVVISATPDDADSLSHSQLTRAFPNAPLESDSVVVLLTDLARLGLNNDGGIVRLNGRDDQAIADVEYTPDWHTPSLEETKGTAIARISMTGDDQAADNWTSSPAAAGGTPGTKNALSLPPRTDAPESTLRASPSPFSRERDGATRIQYTLEDAPSLIRARIYDARGRKVRTLEDARLAGRTGELVWNGRDDAGDRVRIGIYVILFEALHHQEATETQLKTTVVVARPLN